MPAPEERARLLDFQALDPHPGRADLARLHLPFDELRGGQGIESRTARCLERGDRVALVGCSGAGKSSVTEFVGAQESAGLVLLPMPVAVLPPDDAGDVLAVVGQLLDRLRRARPAPRLDSARLSVGFTGLSVETAVRLSEQLEHPPRDLNAASELLGRVVATVGDGEQTPVLVFDDADRWLPSSGFDSPERPRNAFFGRVLRWVAEEVDCAVLVAVHDSYADDVDLTAISDRIAVPPLSTVGELKAVLDHRLQREALAYVADDFIEPDALAALFVLYEGQCNRSLRSTLMVLRHAVHDTAEANLGFVTRGALRGAAVFL